MPLPISFCPWSHWVQTSSLTNLIRIDRFSNAYRLTFMKGLLHMKGLRLFSTKYSETVAYLKNIVSNPLSCPRSQNYQTSNHTHQPFTLLQTLIKHHFPALIKTKQTIDQNRLYKESKQRTLKRYMTLSLANSKICRFDFNLTVSSWPLHPVFFTVVNI